MDLPHDCHKYIMLLHPTLTAVFRRVATLQYTQKCSTLKYWMK